MNTEPRWRKSQHSNPNGACVETASWRKASYSGTSECIECAAFRKSSYSGALGNCAEIGHGQDVVGVRDTKQEHLGDDRTILEFTPDAWRRFISDVKDSGSTWG